MATTQASFTHTISGRKVLRYLPHHHRGALLNKSHAVNDHNLRVSDGVEARTLCGAVLVVQEIPEVVAADGGALFNCRPVGPGSRVTCKDCLKRLGVMS